MLKQKIISLETFVKDKKINKHIETYVTFIDIIYVR